MAPATSKKTATGETSEETVAETPKKTTRTKKTAATSKPAKKAPAKKRAAGGQTSTKAPEHRLGGLVIVSSQA